MVDTAIPRARRPARATYTVEEVADPQSVRPLLEADRAYAAYALAHLGPELLPRTRWWLARPDGPAAGSDRGRGLVLQTTGGLGNAMVTLGDPEAVDAILALHPGARFSFATFKQEHLPAVRRHFILSRQSLMLRMAVTAETFQPLDTLRGGEVAVTRLAGRDIGRINRLYSSEGGPSSYASRNIAEGVYYGVIVDGRLVSIAGTHVVSPSQGIAVLGNVFTHPRYRGQGLATVVTSAVTAHLLRGCSDVLLTVEATNTPAVRVYEKLGYETRCTLYETPAMRKDPIGALAFLRRALARRRSHGREVAR
ncbi:MAG: GNAT family N-acetyltransferase [Chloroflexi bacterium]|nr:GNAT family N-acetyltransferase [Chloroflexota bacterium]